MLRHEGFHGGKLTSLQVASINIWNVMEKTERSKNKVSEYHSKINKKSLWSYTHIIYIYIVIYHEYHYHIIPSTRKDYRALGPVEALVQLGPSFTASKKPFTPQAVDIDLRPRYQKMLEAFHIFRTTVWMALKPCK